MDSYIASYGHLTENKTLKQQRKKEGVGFNRAEGSQESPKSLIMPSLWVFCVWHPWASLSQHEGTRKRSTLSTALPTSDVFQGHLAIQGAAPGDLELSR